MMKRTWSTRERLSKCNSNNMSCREKQKHEHQSILTKKDPSDSVTSTTRMLESMLAGKKRGSRKKKNAVQKKKIVREREKVPLTSSKTNVMWSSIASGSKTGKPPNTISSLSDLIRKKTLPKSAGSRKKRKNSDNLSTETTKADKVKAFAPSRPKSTESTGTTAQETDRTSKHHGQNVQFEIAKPLVHRMFGWGKTTKRARTDYRSLRSVVDSSEVSEQSAAKKDKVFCSQGSAFATSGASKKESTREIRSAPLVTNSRALNEQKPHYGRLLEQTKAVVPTRASGLADGRKKCGQKEAIGPKKPANNDNFVRLNLKNGAGACRGARNKKRKRFARGKSHDFEKSTSTRKGNQRSNGASNYDKANSGVDPLDDFVDGVFQSAKNSQSTKTATIEAPQCARHQRPCRLLTVKKNSTGNKGRKFYVCCMPRGEQCDHFEWAENTKEATKRALLKNSSYTGFVARQVNAYSERFRVLTVAELRKAAKKRNLDHKGKKQQLLARLSIWVRDELASVQHENKADSGEIPRGKSSSAGDETGHYPSDKQFDTRILPRASQSIDPMEDEDENDVSAGFAGHETEDDSSCSSQELEIGSVHQCATDSCQMPSDNGSSVEDTTGNTASKEQLDTKSDRRSIHVLEEENENEDDPSASSVGCETEDDGSCSSDEREMGSFHQRVADDPLQQSLHRLFGFRRFRDGQEWAIRRCLEGKRTLLVAPTGLGKSLCYSLPAAMMDGLCIVVSPLVSLIQDQMRQLPPSIPAATLSGAMTNSSMAATIDDVIRGRLKVLFVSPERLASPSFRRLFIPRWNQQTRSKERLFPDISLFCVDEAHCMSQWGHNFRPTYLRAKSLLEILNPQSVLAITATAGPVVVKDICNALSIPISASVTAEQIGGTKPNHDIGQCGVRVSSCNRDNIEVATTIVKDEEERRILLSTLLNEQKNKRDPSHENATIYPGCLSEGSVIVYVWRQRDAEIVAEQLSAFGTQGGVVVYHGGMDSAARAKSQTKFMQGRARICVATVAFGLGINKADVDAVVHLHLPSSPESWLQEIGRAGRDGRPAKAIALLVKDDVVLRHSLAHSDSISESQVRGLFKTIRELALDGLEQRQKYDPDPDQHITCTEMSVALPVASTIASLDCKFETIETLLSLMENESEQSPLLTVEGTFLDLATIALKRKQLEDLANEEAIAKCILQCSTKVDYNGTRETTEQRGRNEEFLSYSCGVYQFSITACARLLGLSAETRHVYAALRRLQSSGELELTLESRALKIRLQNKMLAVLSGQVKKTSIYDVSEKLFQEFSRTVSRAARKVQDIHDMLHSVANADDHSRKEGANHEDSHQPLLIHRIVSDYFERENERENPDLENEGALPLRLQPEHRKEIHYDVSSLVRDLATAVNGLEAPSSVRLNDPSSIDYTGLALTKFFHGIEAPRTPLGCFRLHSLFGKWKEYEFKSVLDVVTSTAAQSDSPFDGEY